MKSHQGSISRRSRLLGSVIVIAAILIAGPAAAFDQIVVFGDSYSDVGNIDIISNGAYPGAPYFQGRYSNGPLWVEDVAVSLGLTLSASLTPGGKGTDYAYGGAEMTLDQPSVPSLITQTKAYLAAVSGHADPAALYVIFGGINDLLIDWDTNPSQLAVLPNAYAQATLTIATLLKNAGAKSIMLGQVPDAGKTPAWNWSQQEADQASADASAMNAKAVSLINAAVAKGTLGGVKFYTLPTFQMMDQVVAADIASESVSGLPYFTLSNVTSPCVDGDEECVSPNQYFFWDGVHPTAFGHSMLAERALALLSN